MRGGLYNPRPVDDVPVNGQLTHGVTSNRMFDHSADLDAHTYMWDEVVRIAAGVYHLSPLYTRAMSAMALTANVLYAAPYPMSRARTPANLVIEVTTLADPSNIRLGLYADNGSCYPGARITNGGVALGATTGIKTVAYTTQVPKGLIWFAFISDSTPQMRGQGLEFLKLLGSVSALDGNEGGHYYKADTYGNLPDSFPSGASPGGYFPGIAIEWATQP